MADHINVPSIPDLKGKILWRKIQHVKPVEIPIFPKTILDKYKEVSICCDLMHINVIGFLNTISQYIMFAKRSMIENQNIKNIADGITQVHKLYLKCGFNITCMHYDSKFELLHSEMTALCINLNFASKN